MTKIKITKQGKEKDLGVFQILKGPLQQTYGPPKYRCVYIGFIGDFSIDVMKEILNTIGGYCNIYCDVLFMNKQEQYLYQIIYYKHQGKTFRHYRYKKIGEFDAEEINEDNILDFAKFRLENLIELEHSECIDF